MAGIIQPATRQFCHIIHKSQNGSIGNMNGAWQEDEGVIQAIDDLFLATAPHMDDLLSKLFAFKSLPTTEPDIILFGVIGPYLMAYRDSRVNGESPHDSHHRGVAQVLGDPAIAAILRGMAQRGMDAVVSRRSSDDGLF